jgi:hypothetical protein
VAGGGWAARTKWGVPLQQARSFEDSLQDSGGRITCLAPDGLGAEPHRSGKVLALTPGVRGRHGRPADLHSARFQLAEEVRATSSDEVEILVQLKPRMDAETYTSTDGARDVTVAHGCVLLEIHDRPNRRFIGSRRLETGGSGFTATIAEEDAKAMPAAVSPAAIAAWIFSLPLR